jgi:hypothetical protein
MPVPKPQKGESQSDYMSRCMTEVSKNKDRTNEQNVAICLSTWRDSKKSLDMPAMYRSARIASGAIDTDKRLISLSFSSRTPVRRMAGGMRFKEVLSHDMGAIDVGRLEKGVVPLLENHDWNRQIGIIRTYSVENGKGMAVAEISPNRDDVMADIKAGIKTSVSVGYVPQVMRCIRKRGANVINDPDVQRFDTDDDPDDFDPDNDDDPDDSDDNGDDEDLYEVTRWEPIEISLVSVPADPTVGIGRAEPRLYSVRMIEPRDDEIQTNAEVNLHRDITIMADKTYASTTGMVAPNPITPAAGNLAQYGGAVAAVEVRQEDISQIREREIGRIREIQAFGAQFQCIEDAHAFVRDGKSVQDFQTWLLREKLPKTVPVVTIADPNLGQSARERNRYSIHRAIRAKMKALNGEGRFDGYEAEVSAEIARMHNQQPTGFFMPDWFLTRDLTATPPPAGTGGAGYTVQTTVEPSLIPMLRNRTAVLQAGARYISGLQGNLQMPRQYAPSTISWNTEIAAVTESDLAMDAVTLTPNRVGGWCNYSKQLLAQSSLDIDNVVRDDMIQVIQIAIDAAALSGTGTNQPTGILNTPANAPGTAGPAYAYSKTAPSITFPSGYPTWSNIIAFEGNVEAGNLVLDDSACYITTPGVKAGWKSYAKADPRATNQFYPAFYWEPDNTVNGYRAIPTNQVPGNKVVFGKWNELMIGQWAGLDIVVDIYSLAAQAEVRVITNMFVDIKYRYASAFVYSTNSGISN